MGKGNGNGRFGDIRGESSDSTASSSAVTQASMPGPRDQEWRKQRGPAASVHPGRRVAGSPRSASRIPDARDGDSAVTLGEGNDGIVRGVSRKTATSAFDWATIAARLRQQQRSRSSLARVDDS